MFFRYQSLSIAMSIGLAAAGLAACSASGMQPAMLAVGTQVPTHSTVRKTKSCGTDVTCANSPYTDQLGDPHAIQMRWEQPQPMERRRFAPQIRFIPVAVRPSSQSAPTQILI